MFTSPLRTPRMEGPPSIVVHRFEKTTFIGCEAISNKIDIWKEEGLIGKSDKHLPRKGRKKSTTGQVEGFQAKTLKNKFHLFGIHFTISQTSQSCVLTQTAFKGS